MPRRCPFDPTKRCGKKITECPTCDIRMKAGQKMLVSEPKAAVLSEVLIEYETRKFTCPYCLYTDYLTRFLIRLKSGKTSEKRFKCPDCNEIMRRETLLNDMTVEEFAEWVYDTQAWGRIDFSKFKRRLQEMGISYQFWEHYKKHKHEMRESSESYEDYIMRKQQEQFDEETAYADMHGD